MIIRVDTLDPTFVHHSRDACSVFHPQHVFRLPAPEDIQAMLDFVKTL